MLRTLFISAMALLTLVPLTRAEPPHRTYVVPHRGLLLHAPENTLANFSACLNLQLGFEFDVRRSGDGHLVCLHDDTVDRTTDGRGKVSDLTLDQLSHLDAGAWFDESFRGQRVPTIDAVFALLAQYPGADVLAAVDLKGDDPRIERDTVELANKHRVLDRLLFIGRSIDHAEVRQRLRRADPRCHVAVLAQTADDLSQAVADANSDWVYVRFLPTAAQIATARAAGKHVILSGPLVSGHEPERWSQGASAGVDAILTDYSLECRKALRSLGQATRPAR